VEAVVVQAVPAAVAAVVLEAAATMRARRTALAATLTTDIEILLDIYFLTFKDKQFSSSDYRIIIPICV
jgi:hypothetical protein